MSEVGREEQANDELEKGNEAFASNGLQEAWEHYTFSIQLFPTSAAYNSRAITSIKLGRFSDAVHDSVAAWKLLPTSIEALLRRAFAYKCLKNYQGAVADLQKVLQLEPSNLTALTQLEALERELVGASSDLVAANCEAGHSIHATVMGVFDNVSPGRSSSTLNGVSHNVSESELDLATKHNAEPDSSRLLVKEPVPHSPLPNVQSLKDEADTLFKIGSYAEADTKYSAALSELDKARVFNEHGPSTALLLNGRAACLLQIGDFQRCIDDCSRALSLLPLDAKAILNRATAYESLKQYEQAYIDYTAALSIDNAHEQAAAALDRLMSLFKDKNEDGLEVRLHATSHPVTDTAIAAFSGERGFDQGNDDVDDDMKNQLEQQLRDASRDGRTEELTRLLDQGINIEATDEDGRTPLGFAAGFGHVDCVKVLLERGANIDHQTKDGWTSLMRAAYHGRADCVRALVNRGADVNHCNNVGRTSLMYASGIGNAECVKVLLDGGAQTNLKEECEKTALVFALHYGHIDCVKVLLDVKTHHHIDAGSDLYKERLMEASRNGKLEEAIKLIQAEMNSDKKPEQKLYDAVDGNKAKVVTELLDSGVDVNAKLQDEEIPLMRAASLGHVECLNVLLNRGAAINHQTKRNGYTALHRASMFSQVDSVKILLAAPGINVNTKDFGHRIALQLATNYEIITLLKRYTDCCEDYPVHSFGKIILSGDTGSGKTTLAQVIKYRSQLENNKGEMSDASEPEPVKLLTAGIIPHIIKHPQLNMMLFDLAGHHEYYSSHCAVLESISLSPSTFLLLVNLFKSDVKSITLQLYYWSAMIGDVCHKCPQKSSVIVVGTHADQISDQMQLDKKRGVIERVVMDALKKHTFVKYIALNATAFVGEEVERFMSLLHDTNEHVIAQHPVISLNSHVMYAFLNDKIPKPQTAISLSDLLGLLLKEEPKVLPTETTEVVLLLRTLSGKGFIVFMDCDVGNSWIVVRPEVLLLEVNGVLFAPSTFEEHLPIASNTGVIVLPDLKYYFRKTQYCIDMIVQFLFLYDLCQQVTVAGVSTNLMPRCPSADEGPLLFFPAKVKESRPNDLITSSGSTLGWHLHTCTKYQFFSPRFCHVLILRLAYKFCLSNTTGDPCIHEYQRRCKVWKDGVSWTSKEGVDVIVEVRERSHCYVTMSFPSLDRYQVCYAVLEMIRGTCTEFCPSVDVKEAIVDPHQASHVYSKGVPLSTLPCVDYSHFKEAVGKGYPFVVDYNDRKVDVNDWVMAEPHLSHLFKDEVQGLHSELFNITKRYAQNGEILEENLAS
eukprot:Em0007g678a